MITNYLELISINYPNINVYSLGEMDDYEAIVWEDPNEKITKEQLDQECIVLSKKNAIEALSKKCEEIIVSGFTAVALGTPYIYDSEQVDQINLLGAVSATSPSLDFPDGHVINYACRDAATGIKIYREHTHNQIKYVMITGAQFKLVNLQHFHALRILIEQQINKESIMLINWETDPSTFV
jgi:hypothetical protein